VLLFEFLRPSPPLHDALANCELLLEGHIRREPPPGSLGRWVRPCCYVSITVHVFCPITLQEPFNLNVAPGPEGFALGRAGCPALGGNVGQDVLPTLANGLRAGGKRRRLPGRQPAMIASSSSRSRSCVRPNGLYTSLKIARSSAIRRRARHRLPRRVESCSVGSRRSPANPSFLSAAGLRSTCTLMAANGRRWESGHARHLLERGFD